jgi:hypothetical protein
MLRAEILVSADGFIFRPVYALPPNYCNNPNTTTSIWSISSFKFQQQYPWRRKKSWKQVCAKQRQQYDRWMTITCDNYEWNLENIEKLIRK